jgi:hypothetical protein
MPQTKYTSKRKRRKEAVSVVGVVGVSLSLAGGASAATAVPTADMPSRHTAPPQITLSEEEIADVSLGTFYVFDKENAGTPRLGERFAQPQAGGAKGGGSGGAKGGGSGGAKGGGSGGAKKGSGGCGGCGGCRSCGRGCVGVGGCGGCGCGGCGGGGCCLSWGVCRIC